MDLLERDDVLDTLDELLASAQEGQGRVALIRGEAGIGKTSVVRAFVDAKGDEVHLLWGGCDDLLAARPLGPVWDMAMDNPALEGPVRSGDRYEAFDALLDLLGRGLRPTVLVIEDLHWADDATLDLVKYLARRIARTHGLMVITYRDDAVADDTRLRSAFGDVEPGSLQRIDLEPLSEAGIRALVGDSAFLKHVLSVSGGNPFFVSELASSEGDRVPESIRDAIRARVARLRVGRDLIEAASVVPSRIEIVLAKEVVGDIEDALTECEQFGLLEVHGESLAFRHELARRVVESDLTEARRRALNLSVLEACERQNRDLARCAHHAREAGDPEAIVRILPQAARRAAEVESHSESVASYRALEPFLDRLEVLDRAQILHDWAYEEYLENNSGRHVVRRAIELWRAIGDVEGLARSLLVASRIEWVNGRRQPALQLAHEAAEVAEDIGGPTLAMAYSTLSQLGMLGNDAEMTHIWGKRALDLIGDEQNEVRAHVLNNIGAMKAMSSYPDGIDELKASYELADRLGASHDRIRAAVNIAWGAMYWRDLEVAEEWVNNARRISYEKEQPAFESYAQAISAVIAEMRGDWDRAESIAGSIVHGKKVLGTSRNVASTVIARCHVRKGLADAEEMAVSSWREAVSAEEVQRTGPAAGALAEYVWLGGDLEEAVMAEIVEEIQQCLRLGASWHAGDIAQWLWMAGDIETMPDGVAEPHSMLGEGDWQKAARFWESHGCPYEHAAVLSFGDEPAQLKALGIFDALGAIPAGARLRADLQARGVKGVPRGPQKATRENPFGLTSRQAEVLELVADGMSNSEIADRLFVSVRTIDHHVSAILSKLGVSTREAAAQMVETAAPPL